MSFSSDSHATFSLPQGCCSSESQPLILDIGCHRGHFLIQMAGQFPENNFLGVEKQAVRVTKTQKKIDRLNLSNAWVVQADGLAALKALPSGISQGIHVLFPDPWPKRRHSLRRMVSQSFIAECLRVLKNGAYLRIVTDEAHYAHEIQKAALRFHNLVALHADCPPFPPTAFEEKFRAENKPVTTLYWRRDTSRLSDL